MSHEATNYALERLLEILYSEVGRKTPYFATEEDKRQAFRAMCNVRPPKSVDAEFLRLEKIYLTALKEEKGVVHVDEFDYVSGIALWRGDITRLDADAIVNAANSALLGCFAPLHQCIDNAIHSAAGVGLRLELNEIMGGRTEETGKVKVTDAYALPCEYVFHTVGPVVDGKLTEEHKQQLTSCYNSCIDKAVEMRLDTLAFCAISTGVFAFPKEEACDIAVSTVKRKAAECKIPKIIFDVFSEEDEKIYARRLSGTNL